MSHLDVYDELLSLALDAADEQAQCDEGNYRARHALNTFVSAHPGLIVQLIENEEDRMAPWSERNALKLKVDSLEKTVLNLSERLWELGGCPECEGAFDDGV